MILKGMERVSRATLDNPSYLNNFRNKQSDG